MNEGMSVKSLIEKYLSEILFLRVLLFYHKLRALFLLWKSDEQFERARYFKKQGKEIDLDTPTTFDEKQVWLKLHYRDPLIVTCTDKVLVRDYVEGCGLGETLNLVYGIYENPEEIDWDVLPDEFYLKTNHSSATNIRCIKNEVDKAKVVKKARLLLKKKHYPLSREWNYEHIRPKLFAEKLLESASGVPIIDYRFFCSAGKCTGIFVDIGTADEDGTHKTDACRNALDCNFNLLDVQVTRPRFDHNLIDLPKNRFLMLQYAETLAKPFPFCRVDLFDIDGTIVFGEMTFFHLGGANKITPVEWEEKLGGWIDLSSCKPEFIV